jgi:hypothetical protein
MARLLYACGAFFLWVGCGQPVPASTPLARGAAGAQTAARPSSSRAEGSESNEGKDIEKGDAGHMGVGDDDDDDSTGRIRSSSTGGGAIGSECQKPASGPPLDCSRLPRGTSACMGQVLARRVCETVGPSLDQRVATTWSACMREPIEKSRECDTSRIFDCGLKAIESACVDGSQKATCAEIAKSCSDFAPEITVTVCERLLGAWKPDRRDFLLQCLRRGCDVGDFGACLP